MLRENVLLPSSQFLWLQFYLEQATGSLPFLCREGTFSSFWTLHHTTLSFPSSSNHVAFPAELTVFNRFLVSQDSLTTQVCKRPNEIEANAWHKVASRAFALSSFHLNIMRRRRVGKPFPIEQGALYLARGHWSLERTGGTPCRCPSPIWAGSSYGRGRWQSELLSDTGCLLSQHSFPKAHLPLPPTRAD